ncbi:MAG: hypothetical protein EXS16_10895 [Gemmataceae bacterium]|nr:hypothetical protein [Gemmataceae bacterium]
MMIALILVGFIMMTLGVALLFLGEVPFLGGKRISAWRSRLIGLVQVSSLPMALGIWKCLQLLFGSDAIDAGVVAWSLIGVCWFVTFALVYRVMFLKRVPRAGKGKSSASTASEPFPSTAGEDEPATAPFGFAEPEPARTKTAPKKNSPAKRAPAPDDNPFNFS